MPPENSPWALYDVLFSLQGTDLEVLDSPDPELQRGVLVADHERVVMLLEGGHGPHVTHSLFYRLIYSNVIPQFRIVTIIHFTNSKRKPTKGNFNDAFTRRGFFLIKVT